MRRREFIGLIGGAAVTLPLAARAQQAKQVRRIGVLMVYAESDQVFQGWVGSFRDGLAKHGWIAGHNLHIEYRWAGGDSGQLPGLAAELVALVPDAIFAIGSPTVAALQRTTRTVPIVFSNVADPVGAGFVGSLARPGGNITGFAIPEHDALTTKRLELLKQIAPGITRVIVIYDPSSPVWSIFWTAIKEAAPSLDIKISAAPVRNAPEIQTTIDGFAREPNVGLIVFASPAVGAHRDRIIELAARYHLPAVYDFRYFVADGGLASYGVNNVAQFPGAASYVDRILGGADPRDLPVQFADKYELVINLKTAKALGLTISDKLLARADEVID